MPVERCSFVSHLHDLTNGLVGKTASASVSLPSRNLQADVKIRAWHCTKSHSLCVGRLQRQLKTTIPTA